MSRKHLFATFSEKILQTYPFVSTINMYITMHVWADNQANYTARVSYKQI